MGYTHYLQPKKKTTKAQFKKIVADVKKIENHLASVGLVLYDGRGEKKGVVYADDYLAFNGCGDESHETFYFDLSSDFQFCKTNRKPYDIAVCMAMIAIKEHVKDIEVSSDGDFDAEWVSAIEMYATLFPKRKVLLEKE
jgi:hypothetical protein